VQIAFGGGRNGRKTNSGPRKKHEEVTCLGKTKGALAIAYTIL
jgi:hypothetical protein